MMKLIITSLLILFSVDSFAERVVAQDDSYSVVERSILFTNQDQAIELKKMQTGELFSFARLSSENGDLKSFVFICSDKELEENKSFSCAMSGNGRITFTIGSDFNSLRLQPYDLIWNQYDSADEPGLVLEVKSDEPLEMQKSE